MYIIAEKIKGVYERTEESCLNYHLDFFLNSEEFAEYTRILREIAEESKYTEGEQILDSDLDRIKAGAKDVINSISEVLANKEVKEEAKLKYNSLPTLMALTDHLFATAMKELGSPDMPPSFGIENRKTVADLTMDSETKIRAIDYKEATAEEHFKKQRKRDAAVVIKDNEGLEKNIINCRAYYV